MKSTFRPTTSQDAPRLTSFLARAFSVDKQTEFLRPELLHWKLWAAREDYAEPRSYVLERDGQIVAHSGVWPMQLQTEKGLLRGCHMFDWAADSRVLGAGVSLIRKFADMFDFLYANGGSEMTQKIIPSVGFQKFGEAWFAQRPLRPLRQALAHRPLDWKAPARFARNTMRSLGRSSTPPAGWGMKEGIGEYELNPQASDAMTTSRRSSGFFRYLQNCPSAEIRIFQVLKNDRPMGRFALSLVHHQLKLAGLWLNEPSAEARCAAYTLALGAARSIKAAFEIVAVGSTSASEHAAGCAGLRIRNRTSLYWLSSRGNLPPVPFEFQMADNDSVFLP